MQIVLPGALPDAAIAKTLVPEIEKKAPSLVQWLTRAQAEIIPALPVNTLCTPYEYWLLRRHGFEAGPNERPSAGLAALLAQGSDAQVNNHQPLWLGQLVHVAPARDGAALIPANELEITPEENTALFASAAEFFTDSGFAAEPFNATHWRITPAPHYQPHCASPALVSISSVNDWWTQDAEGRPWRRLVNELQMLWFNHPINQQREARGLRPVNSLWLYGGAAPDRLKTANNDATFKVLRTLQGPALIQDWGSWLLELERIEQEIFSTAQTPTQLVLTGNERIVELSPTRQGFMARLLGSKQDWRRWWSAHN